MLNVLVLPQVTVDVPDQKGRLAILKVHAKNKKLADEVDLSQIAMRTPGFSGADLANLLNEVRVSWLVLVMRPFLCTLGCSTKCLTVSDAHQYKGFSFHVSRTPFVVMRRQPF
jgi:hypothetical protein